MGQLFSLVVCNLGRVEPRLGDPLPPSRGGRRPPTKLAWASQASTQRSLQVIDLPIEMNVVLGGPRVRVAHECCGRRQVSGLHDQLRSEEMAQAVEHLASNRFMIKRFVVDLYEAWRTLEGLPVRGEYREEHLRRPHHDGEDDLRDAV